MKWHIVLAQAAVGVIALVVAYLAGAGVARVCVVVERLAGGLSRLFGS